MEGAWARVLILVSQGLLPVPGAPWIAMTRGRRWETEPESASARVEGELKPTSEGIPLKQKPFGVHLGEQALCSARLSRTTTIRCLTGRRPGAGAAGRAGASPKHKVPQLACGRSVNRVLQGRGKASQRR